MPTAMICMMPAVDLDGALLSAARALSLPLSRHLGSSQAWKAERLDRQGHFQLPPNAFFQRWHVVEREGQSVVCCSWPFPYINEKPMFLQDLDRSDMIQEFASCVELALKRTERCTGRSRRPKTRAAGTRNRAGGASEMMDSRAMVKGHLRIDSTNRKLRCFLQKASVTEPDTRGCSGRNGMPVCFTGQRTARKIGELTACV